MRSREVGAAPGADVCRGGGASEPPRDLSDLSDEKEKKRPIAVSVKKNNGEEGRPRSEVGVAGCGSGLGCWSAALLLYGGRRWWW